MVNIYEVNDVKFVLNDGPDMISSCLRRGVFWEPFLIDIIKAFLADKSNPVFVDVGANLGAISVPIGQYLQDKEGQVHSIEAQRGVFYQLCANFFTNQLSKHCFAYNKAISNKIGKIEIPILDLQKEHNIGALSIDENIRHEQGIVTSISNDFETVELTTLDSLNLPKANLVKIDVEGLEYEVISGGENWLKASSFPPLLFEVWGDYMKNQKAKRDALFAFLNNLGYHIDLIGELAVAQHISNKTFSIQLADNTINLLRIE